MEIESSPSSSSAGPSSSSKAWIFGAAAEVAIGAQVYLRRSRRFRTQVVGIIPARYASSRFPGKPLVQILGNPMIQRTWERAKMSSTLDNVALLAYYMKMFVLKVISPFLLHFMLIIAASSVGEELFYRLRCRWWRFQMIQLMVQLQYAKRGAFMEFFFQYPISRRGELDTIFPNAALDILTLRRVRFLKNENTLKVEGGGPTSQQ